MEKGFNSDVQARGKKYHVQTEDWGNANPFLVSRIFFNGAVLKTIKVSYTEALKTGPVNEAKAVQQAMQRQHKRIVDDLISGQIGL